MTYTKCLDISGNFKHMIVGKDVMFICICCHLMKQYKNGLSLLYFSFYRDDQAVLPRFLLILATLEISQYAEISLAFVLFIHLKSYFMCTRLLTGIIYKFWMLNTSFFTNNQLA
ncbi:hypothetical protein EV424DRAFT_1346477 [Suillus variegatus]|nr:hypothetical protein EV424DRAFT_1346477 [Suillus variegatus]